MQQMHIANKSFFCIYRAVLLEENFLLAAIQTESRFSLFKVDLCKMESPPYLYRLFTNMRVMPVQNFKIKISGFGASLRSIFYQ